MWRSAVEAAGGQSGDGGARARARAVTAACRPFGMGTVRGSLFHFLKGTYNSPNGERLVGGAQAVLMNAAGGRQLRGVFMHQKEDLWNSIIAGAATSGFLSMRQGLNTAGRSALMGGMLLALIEGAGLMLNRVLASPRR
uniref:Protein translocase-like protein n=1 Tax=Oryza sativa subsp. japonica TaxID=39947 RepID=Q8H5T8_ORYSJ|nr:protein translocase-like protein [Oryza sativa Japonica Group]